MKHVAVAITAVDDVIAYCPMEARAVLGIAVD
jgi:hypothetical protein